MTDRYVEETALWSGDLSIAVFDENGDMGGERDVGNASVFNAATPSIEKKEMTGMRRSNYGQTIKSLISKTDQEFSITLTDVNRKNLALAMLGTDAAYSQSAGRDAAAVEYTALLGFWVKLAHRNLDPENPPIVTNDGATTTYVEGEDYDIDYESGRIYFIPTADGGTIVDEATVEITTEWLVHSGYSVTALDNLTIEAQLRLVIQDQARDNRRGELIIYKAQVEPAGDLSWLTEEYTTIQLKAKVLSYLGKTWEVVLY